MSMTNRKWRTAVVAGMLATALLLGAGWHGFAPATRGALAAPPPTEPQSQPSKIYVPYDQLRTVLQSQKQGVFLPRDEFDRLWKAALGAPAGVEEAPVPYLISTARFKGRVGAELATLQLELTLDILADGWVDVPIALREVAVTKTAFTQSPTKDEPLLRVVDGQYRLLARGKGRRVMVVDFVRQLVTQPGLNILSYGMPPAAITTLELLIPEENMKVDVEPALAASTSQVDAPVEAASSRFGTRQDAASTPATRPEAASTKATLLQAFLGAADHVKLSWKPRTQAAEELAPVVIADVLQHIDVGEAVVTTDVKLNYDIRRRGVETFTIQLPGDSRVVSVEGANISRWDVSGGDGAGGAATKPTTVPAAGAAGGAAGPQILTVRLYSPAKDAYTLDIRMERFLQDAKSKVPLAPVVTHQALRTSGLVAVTHSPRRAVEVTGAKNLARVDIGRLPEALRARAGAAAWRFLSADYSATLEITAVAPRISLQQLWALGVEADRMHLQGRLTYTIERSGVFELSMLLPEPWLIVSVGPKDLVDDHQIAGKGAERKLTILLKREATGTAVIDVVAKADRAGAESPVDFTLPAPDGANLQTYAGQLVLWLAPQFRAEVDKSNQMQPLPLDRAIGWASIAQTAPAMALEFQAVDLAKPAGATFKITQKPPQVSAAVYRLVNIQPGSIEQQAIVQYRILNAPVDTFYLTVPSSMASEVQIKGENIKEQRNMGPAGMAVDSGIGEAVTRPAPPTAPAAAPADARLSDHGTHYVLPITFKIVLQSPVMGSYELTVTHRRSFLTGGAGASTAPTTVSVEPILAAGKLSDQSGTIAIQKADTLALGVPKSENLIPCDPGSEADLPYAPHRQVATIAFKYTAPPYELSIPVAVQKEADVFTRIATAAVLEQVIDRNGTLQTHATWLLSTSRGDRLAIRLPAGAKVFSVLVNGKEAAVESGATPDERVLRLPPSAGQVAKVVVEVSYNQENASAGDLHGPELLGGVPVQQTLWRLWVPQDDYVLAYDRTFSRVGAGEAQGLLNNLAEGQPVAPAFRLEAQGVAWDFLRQGPPGRLSVSLAGKEFFNIAIWVVVLVLGAIMLALGGFRRLLVVLAVLVAGAVVNLFAPLLARRLFSAAVPAGCIVLLLWLGHWFFFRWARRPKSPAIPAAAFASKEAPKAKE